MKRFRLAVLSLVLMGVAMVCPGQVEKDNPQLGTWKMNIAKSTFSSGTGFKSATSHIEAIDGGVRHTLDTVYGDGTARQYSYTTMYDGKDRPVVGNSPYGDTTALTRLDERSTKTVYKMGGKVTVTQISTVSPDGKVRTVVTTGTNPKGQAVHNISVYDRQ